MDGWGRFSFKAMLGAELHGGAGFGQGGQGIYQHFPYTKGAAVVGHGTQDVGSGLVRLGAVSAWQGR